MATTTFLSFRQLNFLAIILILASTSMVSLTDIAFSLLSIPYLYFLSHTSFPHNSPIPPKSPLPPSKIFTAYVSAGAVVGLLLPIAYILLGLLAGDKEGIKAAAPHLFLLSAQIFLEGITFTGLFSLPIRAFVPIFYNSKRLFTIYDWVLHELYYEVEGEQGTPWRLVAGRALAVANLMFWSFNLLGFLLPVYLPRAMMSYYRATDGVSVTNSSSKIKD